MKISEGGLLRALAKTLSDYQGQEIKVHIYCMPPRGGASSQTGQKHPPLNTFRDTDVDLEVFLFASCCFQSQEFNLKLCFNVRMDRDACVDMVIYISLANIPFFFGSVYFLWPFYTIQS